MKRNTSGVESTSLRPDPNGATAINVTVRRLVRVAYGVADFQIVDAPAWFESEHYDVIGRAPTAVSQSDLGSMIKSMLAERFGLRVDQGVRELPGFELRIERAERPGLRPAPVSCSAPPGNPGPAAAQPVRPGCFSAIAGDMTARGVSSELRARQLTAVVRQPVIDRTALAGTFDFELRWRPDTSSDAGADLPPLVTAIREQLGLRLVPARVTVDVIVVKSAVRPAEN